MVTIEAVPAGLLPFTSLKRAEEEFRLHHHAHKKHKPMTVINYSHENNDNDDDSWEVRAFAEDTGMGTTWPPRFYSCRFCLRHFRSAQALGGHMNVHRRDRARAHMQQQLPPSPVIFPVAVESSSAYSSAIFSTISFAEPVSVHSLLGKAESNDDEGGEVFGGVEELDLDLRLGW